MHQAIFKNQNQFKKPVAGSPILPQATVSFTKRNLSKKTSASTTGLEYNGYHYTLLLRIAILDFWDGMQKVI